MQSAALTVRVAIPPLARLAREIGVLGVLLDVARDEGALGNDPTVLGTRLLQHRGRQAASEAVALEPVVDLGVEKDDLVGVATVRHTTRALVVAVDLVPRLAGIVDDTDGVGSVGVAIGPLYPDHCVANAARCSAAGSRYARPSVSITISRTTSGVIAARPTRSGKIGELRW